MQENFPDYNLFMMCPAPNAAARAPLPVGFTFRLCRPDELPLWRAMPFDTPELAQAYAPYMARYFQDVYKEREPEFFSRCLFVCSRNGEPVATAFLWDAYGCLVPTLHWLKVIKEYEGRGIGRALLTRLLLDDARARFPLFLHTQPSSFRAIKLYTDFGFRLLTDEQIGPRKNHLSLCLPLLERAMPASAYAALQFCAAPASFLQAVSASGVNEF